MMASLFAMIAWNALCYGMFRPFKEPTNWEDVIFYSLSVISGCIFIARVVG